MQHFEIQTPIPLSTHSRDRPTGQNHPVVVVFEAGGKYQIVKRKTKVGKNRGWGGIEKNKAIVHNLPQLKKV